MTTITLKTDKYDLQNLEVNGRLIACEGRISEIAEVSAGRWEGEASGYPFVIIGGRASGGGPRDWFVQWDALAPGHYFPVNSAAAAVRMIENS